VGKGKGDVGSAGDDIVLVFTATDSNEESVWLGDFFWVDDMSAHLGEDFVPDPNNPNERYFSFAVRNGESATFTIPTLMDSLPETTAGWLRRFDGWRLASLKFECPVLVQRELEYGSVGVSEW
jgi:hypothetical protein